MQDHRSGRPNGGAGARGAGLDLHRLRLLRELKHRGTLAAVAEALAYSPSTVSEQLSQLSADVGVPLLEPAGRRVRLTAQAEILVRHTEAVFEHLERAESEIAASHATLGGTLRIAAFQTATLALVPPALTQLRERHAGLRVQVTQLEPEVALPRLPVRDFDLVVGEAYPGDVDLPRAGVHVEDLAADPLRLAVPHVSNRPAGKSRPITIADLADRPWVMEPAGSRARSWAQALCRQAGFDPDVRFETADLLIHVRLVEQGHAVGILPDLVWLGRTPTVGLHALPAGHTARRIFTAVREGSESHPAIRACRRALADAVAAARPQR
jgi:DNA-binding transcriptional LysR family regulator